MFVEQSPSYGAVTGGLSAPYSIDFGADLDHIIPLNSLWQGDPAFAKSLYVDNYNNSYSLTVSEGNLSSVVPAYSIATIDIRGFSQVTISAVSAGIVKVNVLNYVAKYEIVPRGATPYGLSNDVYYASVFGLWHLNGNDGVLVGVDSKGTRNMNLIAPYAQLSTGDKIFGNASGKTNAIYNTSAVAFIFADGAGISATRTVEFFFKIAANMPGEKHPLYTFYTGGNNSEVLALNCDGNGKMGLSYLQNGLGVPPPYTGSIDTPFDLIKFDQWYYCAIASISAGSANSTQIFLGLPGGVASAVINSTATLVPGNPSTQFCFLSDKSGGANYSAKAFIDEIRVTETCRYQTDFMAPTQEFFNQ